MRTNGTLNYILGDHLGSTSLVTDSAGNVLSQQKYKAWGEERYSSGAKQTSYGFTGQDSYEPEFGLQFFNARWYDSSLGRFAQADSIVPGGVQGLDRYAAMNNNPLRHVDPSGHVPCEGKNWDDGPKCLENPNSQLSRLVKLNHEFKNFDFIDTATPDEMIPISIEIGNVIIADADISPAEENLLLLPDGSRDQVLMFYMWLTEQEAILQAESIFGNDFIDGSPGNAFLHAYWNALMTLRFGEEFAEQFATAHETAAGNNVTSQFMDMHNNEIGRDIGKNYVDSYSPSNPTPTELLVSTSILNAMNNGDLVVLEATTLFYSNECSACVNIP